MITVQLTWSSSRASPMTSPETWGRCGADTRIPSLILTSVRVARAQSRSSPLPPRLSVAVSSHPVTSPATSFYFCLFIFLIMPNSCAVRWCGNTRKKTKGLNIKYYRFPKEHELRLKWIQLFMFIHVLHIIFSTDNNINIH